MIEWSSDPTALREISNEVCRAVFAEVEELTVSECADRHRVLPKTSAHDGRFSTDFIPYLRGIQDALGDPDVPEVVFAKSAQVAGTTVGENFILYVMVQAPSALLSIWPTKEKYQIWVGERLDPMIDDCDVLRPKFNRSSRRDEAGGGRRESGDSLSKKKFPGGFLQCLTSKSTSLLKSIAAQIAIVEEVDEMVATPQGDVVALIRVRQRTYGSARKLYMNSTPTLLGASRIWKELEVSTWNEYWVPCPHCEQYQVLRWRDGEGDEFAAGRLYFTWEKDDYGLPIPGTTQLICQHCSCTIEERDKRWMIDRGEWRPRFPGRRTVGFHISSLYSPLARWDELVEEFVKAAKAGPDEMMVWVNTWLGLPYADKESRIDPHYLAQRAAAEAFKMGDIPDGVGMLVAGADVQGNRVEVFVWGYGAEEEEWLIAWEVLEGEPERPAVWRKLEEVLNREWTHTSGAKMRITRMAVDAGYAAEHVHRFCDSHARAIAVIGRSGPGRQYLTAPSITAPSKWRKKGKKNKRPSYVLGDDTLKNDLMKKLAVKEPGPGFLHIPPDVDSAFYDQLTAERPVRRRVGRQVVRIWEKIEGRANEALDGWKLGRVALRKEEMETPRLLARLGEMAAELSAYRDDGSAKVWMGPRRRVFSEGI